MATETKTTYVFRNNYSQQIVNLPAIGRQVQFFPEGYNPETNRPLGVFRTDEEAVAEALRATILAGHIPAYEEDEETTKAEEVLKTKRDRAMKRALASAAKAP